jgi:hypothetical protein
MLLWRLIEKDGTQSEMAFSIARPPEPELLGLEATGINLQNG